MKTRIPLLLSLLALAACADEFEDYGLISDFRLLGIAADRPALSPGETATISALVTDQGASYSWSWCPLTTGPAGGYACAVTRDELQAGVDDALGEGVVTIPPFELGSDPEAQLTYDLPPELYAQICEVLLGEDLPDGVDFPICDGAYDVQIRLETSAAGKTIVGVRDLAMRYELDTPPNQNPQIGAITAQLPGAGAIITLDPGAATPLLRETVYEVRVDIDSSSSESYTRLADDGQPEQVREDLFLSWFREAGDFDKGRSSFLDGATTFEVLTTNELTTPSVEDYADATARLYFVLRDNRGGTTWAVRELTLETP